MKSQGPNAPPHSAHSLGRETVVGLLPDVDRAPTASAATAAATAMRSSLRMPGASRLRLGGDVRESLARSEVCPSDVIDVRCVDSSLMLTGVVGMPKMRWGMHQISSG